MFFKNDGGIGQYGGSTSVSFGDNRLYDNGPDNGNGSFSTTLAPN